MQSVFKRYSRYMTLLLRWLFIEKPRGLDFSMRNKSFGITAIGNNGYALTPTEVLHDIFADLDIENDDCFIDIGCGKGGVLRFACDYPFYRIAGIEVEPFLCDIARKNMGILGLQRTEIINSDATSFDHYQDFNFFYLYNPFSLDIYTTVIQIILSIIKENRTPFSKIYLICYGKSDNNTIATSELFQLIKYSKDSVKDTDIHIWKWTSNTACF